MEYSKRYKGKVRKFGGLREVISRFELAAGEPPSGHGYRISTETNDVSYSSLDELLVSRFLGDARGCIISLSTPKSTFLTISGGNWDESYASTTVTVRGIGESEAESLAETVATSLAISDNVEWRRQDDLRPSIFIGHAFDPYGRPVAESIGSFLRILGFDVVTGEPFQVNRVSDKVKELIGGQGAVICIFTGREQGDAGFSDWVRDEATFASALEKPLFVLVERRIEKIPGIHGDLEYIAFDKDDLAPVFIKLIQGLKSIGFEIRVDVPSSIIGATPGDADPDKKQGGLLRNLLRRN